MARASGGNVEKADSILRKHYYGGQVGSIVKELARAVKDGEITEEDGVQERLNEDVDSALTYTKDQYLAIYTSDKSSDALEEAVDNGAELDPKNPTAFIGQWAYFTLMADVQHAMEYMDEWKDLAKPWEE